MNQCPNLISGGVLGYYRVIKRVKIHLFSGKNLNIHHLEKES